MADQKRVADAAAQTGVLFELYGMEEAFGFVQGIHFADRDLHDRVWLAVVTTTARVMRERGFRCGGLEVVVDDDTDETEMLQKWMPVMDGANAAIDVLNKLADGEEVSGAVVSNDRWFAYGFWQQLLGSAKAVMTDAAGN